MIISNINIFIDYDTVKLSNEHSAYMSKMYLKVDEYIFPHDKYIALPAMIMRWLLKEIRLIKGKTNTIKERHIYFYPEDGIYIKFELMDNDILHVSFVNREIEKTKNVFHTIFSQNVNLLSTDFFIYYKDFFMETYNQAILFYERYKDQYPRGGDMLVLQEELNLSKKLAKELSKN
jgi:hypothetical protein